MKIISILTQDVQASEYNALLLSVLIIMAILRAIEGYFSKKDRDENNKN